MARQRKAFPSAVSNRAAKARRRVIELNKEKKERARQKKAFEKLKRGG